MDDQDDIPKEWTDPRYVNVVAFWRSALISAANRGGGTGCVNCRGLGVAVMVDRSTEPYRPYSVTCGCVLRQQFL